MFAHQLHKLYFFLSYFFLSSFFRLTFLSSWRQILFIEQQKYLRFFYRKYNPSSLSLSLSFPFYLSLSLYFSLFISLTLSNYLSIPPFLIPTLKHGYPLLNTTDPTSNPSLQLTALKLKTGNQKRKCR